MRAELRSLFESSRIARSGVDLANRADSALDETGERLSRMREPAVQASNDTLSDVDRARVDSALAGTGWEPVLAYTPRHRLEKKGFDLVFAEPPN